MSDPLPVPAPVPDPQADPEPASAPAPPADEAAWDRRLAAARGDDAALLTLLQGAAPLAVRLAAVDALAGEPALAQAERELRGQDRRVHRLAKRRLGQVVTQRDTLERAAGLVADAKALAAEPEVALERLAAIEQAWQALDARLVDEAGRGEFDALMATLHERAGRPWKVGRWTAQARELAARLHAGCLEAAGGRRSRKRLAADGTAALAMIDGVPAEVRAEVAGAQALADLVRAVELAARLDERLELLELEPGDEAAAAAAPAAAPGAAPDAAAPAAAGPMAHEVEKRWQALPPLADEVLQRALEQRFIRWRHTRDQANAARRARERQQAREREHAARAAVEQPLVAALECAEAALAAGQLAPLHNHLVEIDRLIDRGVAAEALRARIDAVQAQYAQLKGWQHWAGGRARDELVHEAEALAAEVSLPAEGRAAGRSIQDLAGRIDGLRARWKELDRLGGATSRSLWKRFEAALKKAYQPVAAQAAARRAARSENLAARERLLAELDAVPLPGAEAGTADWRVVGAAVDRFQAAWRRLGPPEHTVPREAREPLAARMGAALQRLEGPLRQARDAARAEREQLVAQARALEPAATGGHARDLVAAVRDLQAQWQQQARRLPLGRADEEALWKAFKSAIDSAFQARDAAVQAREAQWRERDAERVALIERLEALSPQTPAAQLRRALAEAEQQWRRMAPPPRVGGAALENRFQSARETVRRSLAEGARRDWQARCDALVAKLGLCEQVESGAAGADAPEAVAARWAEWPPAPEPLEQALARRAGLPPAAAPGEVARVDAASDDLLLRLEAAWGLPSPPAFEPARHLLKLQAMKAALETRRPAQAPVPPAHCLAELLRRPLSDAAQRERLQAIVAALRRRGSLEGA